MKLSEFRATYPQYDDLSDKELADGLYQSHYSDMPKADFYKSIGLSNDRTLGEVGTDTLKSLASGVGSTIEQIGTVGQLLTPFENASKSVKQFGKDTSDYWRNSYSEVLKSQMAEQQDYINQGDNEASKFWRTIESTATNPALLGTFIAESAPQMLAGGAVGRGVGLGAKVLGAGEQLVGRAAVGGAVGTNALMQGADSAGNTYDTLMKLDDSVWAQNPQFQALLQQGANPNQAKDMIAQDLARKTLAESGAISLATQGVASKFGGNAFERALVGQTEKGTVGGIAGKALAEAGSEAVEEGGGQGASNYNVNQVTPTSLFKDVGQSAGQGFITGLAMGGVGGAAEATAKPKTMTQLVEEEKAKLQGDVQSATQGVNVVADNLTNQYELNKPTSPVIDTPQDVPTIEKPSETTVKQPSTDVVETPTQEVAPQSNNGEATVKENLTTDTEAKLAKANAMEKQSMQNGDIKTAKKISEAKKEIKDELMFSKADEKDLIVQHNLSADNLHHALKIGGLAVPSLAITKKDTPLTGFGEITLIGDKELANPKGKSNTKVFGADIYSPRHPREEREYKTADIRKMDKSLEKYSRTLKDGSINDSRDIKDLYSNRAMQMKFLEEEKGIKIDIPMQKNKDEESIARNYPAEYEQSLKNKGIDWQTLYKDDNFVQKVISDLTDKLKERGKDTDALSVYGQDGINNIARDRAMTIDAIGRSQGKPDFYAMRDMLRKEIEKHDEQYKEYVEKFTEPYEHKSYFYADNKKKAYNQNTVLKYLVSNLRGGENWNYGSGNVRAMVTPEFKSIEEIKKAKGRLTTNKEFEAIKESLNNELIDIANEIASKDIGNKFTATDIATEFIQDYAKRGIRAISDYAVNVTPESLKRIDNFLNKLKEAPTEYFEAKITRMAQPSEFKSAVVPDNASQKTLDALKQQGLNIKTYKSGDEADRARAIKEASEENDLLFNKGKYKGTTTDKAKAIVQKTLGNSKASKDVEVVQTFNELPKSLKARMGELETQETPQYIKDINLQTRGVFDPQTNKAYLIAETMGEHEVKGILLHELMHRSINKIVAEKGGTRLDAIMGSKLEPIAKRLNDLEKQGDKDVLQAIKKVNEAETPEQHKLEETLAYLLQNETNKYSTPLKEFLHDLVVAIKDFVKRVAVKVGVDANWLASQMTVDDIANILKSYALEEESATINDKPMMSKDASREEIRTELENKIKSKAIQRAKEALTEPKNDTYTKEKSWFMNTLPQKYMDALNTMLSSKNLMLRQVGTIKTALSQLELEQRVELHKYIGGDIDTIADELKPIANKVRKLIDDMGDELVKNGVLPKEFVEAWQGKYIYRHYKKDLDGAMSKFKTIIFNNKKTLAKQFERGYNLVTDKESEAMKFINGYMKSHGHDELGSMGIENAIEYLKKNDLLADDKQWKSEGKIKVYKQEDGKYKLSRDFTQDERTEMEEITDASFSVPDTLMRMSLLLEHGKFLKRLNDNLDEQFMSDEFNRDSGFEQIPNKPQFGMLAGKWVRPDIHEQIVNTHKMIFERNGLFDMWLKYLSIWKKSKTVWSPTGHINNFFSNVFIKYGLGLNPFKHTFDAGTMIAELKELENLEVQEALGKLTDTARIDELRAKLQDAIELRDANMLGRTELVDLNRGFEQEGLQPETSTRFGKAIKGVDEIAEKLYQGGDTVNRLSAYMLLKESGVDKADAMEMVSKLFPDYTQPMPKVWRVLRDSGVSPFISWTYYTLPSIFKMTKANPMRAVGAYAFLVAMSALATGASSDDWDEFVNAYFGLPEEAIGRRIPIYTNNGKTLTWKVDRMIPGMDLASPLIGAVSGAVKGYRESGEFSHTNQKAYEGMVSGAMNFARGLVGGIPTNLYQNFGGKDNYTNRDIVDKNAPDRVKSYQKFKYAVEQYAPIPTPLMRAYDIAEGKLMDEDERKRGGTVVPRNAIENAVGFAGLNVLRYDMTSLAKQQKDFSEVGQEFAFTKTKLDRISGMISEAKARHDVEEYKRLNEKYSDKLVAIKDMEETQKQLTKLKKMRDEAYYAKNDEAVLKLNKIMNDTMKSYNERNKK